MGNQVVACGLVDNIVRFEIEQTEDFRPVSTAAIVGRVQEAAEPAVAAAKAVLERIAEARPEQVELKFGIKVSGTANWIVARAVLRGSRDFQRHPQFK
ncbi:CU044_2847 family protein [Streptomyces sp. R11]|uniref:CU044_2847 family protein n=1 Tax=Streptomyces sp. R11 TaxID=3238625 RepID=A0AB39MPX9_9ACTN